MPQATERERKWAMKKFGSIDCGPIDKWLIDRGFTSDENYNWHRLKPPNPQEMRAIDFLIDEWDYGFFYVQEAPDAVRR